MGACLIAVLLAGVLGLLADLGGAWRGGALARKAAACVAFAAAAGCALQESLAGFIACAAVLSVVVVWLRRSNGSPLVGWGLQLLVHGVGLALASVGCSRVAGVVKGSHVPLDWLGSPFAGDPGTTLVFAGLATPFVAPGVFGGALAGADLLSGSLNDGSKRMAVRASALEVIAATLLPALVLVVGLGRCYAGSEALLTAGVVAALLVLMQLVAAPFRPHAAVAALIAVGFGVHLAALVEISEASEDAFALALVSITLAATGVVIGVLTHRHQRADGPGAPSAEGPVPRTRAAATGVKGAPAGPLGQRVMSMAFFGVSAFSCAAGPWTLGFDARSRSLGALVDEHARGALILAAISAAAWGLAVLPSFAVVWRSRSTLGQREGLRSAYGSAALGLAAVLIVGCSVAPEPLLALVAPNVTPAGAAVLDLFPSSIGQASLFAGAALTALVFWRWVGPAN